MITPEQVKAIIEAIKNGDSQGALDLLEQILATAAGAPADGGGGGSAEPTADAGMMASLAQSLGTDVAGVAGAVAQLRAKVETIDADRAALELTARRDLVGELVRLGKELPATAWVGDAKDRNPCARLMAEPIADLRTRVEQYRKVAPPAPPAPPEGRGATADGNAELTVDEEVKTLSRETLAKCKAAGIEPKDFVERRRDAVRRIGQ